MRKTKIIFLSVIILISNLIWEFSHANLYNDLTGTSLNLHLIIASFGDLFFIFLILGAISIINNSLDWIKKPTKKDYFLIIIFSLVVSIVIEVINLNLERWSYKETMPIILGIGLTPLIQLAVTSVLSLIIVNKFILKI